MKKLLNLPIILICVLSPLTQAVELSPYEVVQSTGKALFSRISSNQKELEKCPELMQTIVEEELMPNVDHKYAAYKILGKNLRYTSRDQRRQFNDSMRSYLVRTYANILNLYSNQTVVYSPEKLSSGKKVVNVNLDIVALDKSKINIVFKMHKHIKTKKWQAFDIVVAGISLLQSKRLEIHRQIVKQGIEQVAINLASANR